MSSNANSRKDFAIYAITKHGIEIATRLREQLPNADLYVSKKLWALAPESALELALPMGPTLAETFTQYNCHVHVISVGAVVRMIAPLLKDKKVDPAIICVDDAAQFAICVLSGHVGRGNAFTDRIAEILGAQSVVTTASDVRGTLTVDILGRNFGWRLDDADRNVTRGCAAVVNATRVMFIQETGEPDWWPLDKALPEGVEYSSELDGVDAQSYEILLIATDRLIKEQYPAAWENSVIYRPKSLILGIGCDKNTPPDLLERGVIKLLEENKLSFASIREVATIDLKKGEPAIVAFCEKYGLPLRTYPAGELDVVVGIENPSETVKRHVGTASVSEAAALLAAGSEKLLVAKKSYTEDGAERESPASRRSMTLAVARIPFAKRETRVIEKRELAHV